MNEGAALGLVLDQVSKDKNIDRHVLVETLEQAILTAAKKAFGMQREMEAKFNEETGRVDLFQIIVIAEQITEETKGKEISLEDANRFNLKAEVGDELLFQIFYDEKDQAKAEEQDAKYGALLELNRAWKGFGRIAAQTAKQVILQRVREAERENVFNQYKERKGELISSIVRRFERGNIVVDLGGAEAVLLVRDQVPRESYRAGDRIVAYVVDIDKTARGPQIILSRTHKGLLEKLFEMEVPEIYEKIVRIEASARESGALRVQRHRAGRGRARDHRRRQPHDGADRPRRQAVAGHRQEGPERAPGVAADRLAHRHPLGVEGARDGAAVARVDGRHRGRGQRGVGHLVQARLALGRRCRRRQARGAVLGGGHRERGRRAQDHRGRGARRRDRAQAV